ncbi:MAG: DUF4065 domain-containing protein [Sporomusaceae bacterium]|jgi:uncharacterized phage-associated protein|nr:DUF4065 domain-containing protein [Sporomusaceae bacterium]
MPTKAATHTASDIAKWLLRRNKAEMDFRDAEYMSHLKLQKLLYYAQGAYLAFYNQKLFQEDLLKWEHGPVVEAVYQEYKNWGSDGITEFSMPVESYLSAEEETLEIVYDNFGQYSAWKLRNMTHAERPWQYAKKDGVISIKVIRDFFLEEYVKDEPEH